MMKTTKIGKLKPKTSMLRYRLKKMNMMKSLQHMHKSALIRQGSVSQVGGAQSPTCQADQQIPLSQDDVN